MGLWNKNICRCYLKQNEIDSFHIMEYEHRLLIKKREEIFLIIQQKLTRINSNADALQLFLDILVNQD